MWRNREENCLTLSALGAVDRHAGYLRSLAAKSKQRTRSSRTRSHGCPNAGAATGPRLQDRLTSAGEQEVLHVVAEGNVHVAAVELAGQAAAVEGSDGVGAAGSGCVRRG